MIITKIIGGLGNQLFQYAAGRCLAELNKSELQLDVSGFDEYKLRNFDLLQLNIKAGFAHDDDVHRHIPETILGRALQRLLPPSKKGYYRERFFHFDSRLLRCGDNVYIKGYWQSEKYFLPIEEIIREEITFKPGVMDHLRAKADELSSIDSVAVHIRRGDYTNPVVTEMHGILGVDYYKRGIQRMIDLVPSAEFYFFSDDIHWVRSQFKDDRFSYSSGELTKNHFEDFYLMQKCRHQIIANSSFSWWTAWLNKFPEKNVIAPKNWFNKGPEDLEDLLPEKWEKL